MSSINYIEEKNPKLKNSEYIFPNENYKIPEKVKKAGTFITGIKIPNTDEILYIVEKVDNWILKVYWVDSNWKAKFLPKEWLIKDNNLGFNFWEVDGKILLYVEYDWIGFYFDKKWNRYIPKTKLWELFTILAHLPKYIKKYTSYTLEYLLTLFEKNSFFLNNPYKKISEKPEKKGSEYKKNKKIQKTRRKK